MKKYFYCFFLLAAIFNSADAQKIKLFDSYLRFGDLETRYVVVLSDNSIWWYAPEEPWKKSSTDGLPAGYDIKLFSAYSKEDGSSRYVAVLSDNSVWWYAPGESWKQSSMEGLPAGYSFKSIEAYTKTDGTRYVAVLADNSIWWYAPDNPWKKSSMEGLPK